MWKGWYKCRVLPVVTWFGKVAATGYWELETVDMQAFLIGVGKKADKIMLLQAGGLDHRVNIGTGSLWIHALLQSLCLRVFLISGTISFLIILVRQVDYHLPLAIGVHRPLRAAIENI